MNRRDRRFFQIARLISTMSTHGRFKVGAVIAKKGKLIAAGVNSDKSHPVQKHYDRVRGFKTHHNCHAEVRAVLNSRLNVLTGCSIYVYRETKNGTLGKSRPCPACIKMLRDYDIKHIYYTTEEGFCEEILV